jgi:hypothetical protein
MLCLPKKIKNIARLTIMILLFTLFSATACFGNILSLHCLPYSYRYLKAMDYAKYSHIVDHLKIFHQPLQQIHVTACQHGALES